MTPTTAENDLRPASRAVRTDTAEWGGQPSSRSQCFVCRRQHKDGHPGLPGRALVRRERHPCRTTGCIVTQLPRHCGGGVHRDDRERRGTRARGRRSAPPRIQRPPPDQVDLQPGGAGRPNTGSARHPTLTLGCRPVCDDELLAIYLHEQLHWYAVDAPGLDAAVEEMRRWYPSVPPAPAAHATSGQRGFTSSSAPLSTAPSWRSSGPAARPRLHGERPCTHGSTSRWSLGGSDSSNCSSGTTSPSPTERPREPDSFKPRPAQPSGPRVGRKATAVLLGQAATRQRLSGFPVPTPRRSTVPSTTPTGCRGGSAAGDRRGRGRMGGTFRDARPSGRSAWSRTGGATASGETVRWWAPPLR